MEKTDEEHTEMIIQNIDRAIEMLKRDEKTDELIKKILDSVNLRVTSQKNKRNIKKLMEKISEIEKEEVMTKYICCYCREIDEAIYKGHLGCLKMIHKIDGRVEMRKDIVEELVKNLEMLEWLYKVDEDRIKNSFSLIKSIAEEKKLKDVLLWLKKM